MNSSGIKRGLAIGAISALAVTGFPLAASANSIDDQVGGQNTVVLFNFDFIPVSTQFDGQDTTFRLEAGASPDVTAVTFQISTDNGATFTDLETVFPDNDNGAFFFESAVPDLLPGQTVDFRAIEAGSDIGPNPRPNDNTNQIAEDVGVDSTLESVNLTADSACGVFFQPQGGMDRTVIVSGTTSQDEPPAGQRVQIFGLNVDGGAQNASSFAVSTAEVENAPGATTGTFRGVIDITGFVFGGTGPDQLVFAAQNDSTEDFEACTLFTQVITTVTTREVATGVPGQANDVIVTVLDQNGDPIAGAEVRNTDGTPPVETDENGEAEFLQAGDSLGFFFANATDSDPFEPQLGDVRESAATPPPPPPPAPNPDPNCNVGQDIVRPGLKLTNVNRARPGMDRVKVGAECAKGAKVRLFLVTGGGKTLFRSGNISDRGAKIWILPDPNRSASRTFFAKVTETDENKAGTTPRKSIR